MQLAHGSGLPIREETILNLDDSNIAMKIREYNKYQYKQYIRL
jgi:hypothetical protein